LLLNFFFSLQTQCASTQYCDNGTCRTKVNLNATCRKDQQCKSGLCLNQKCTSSTSRPNGAACTSSTSCVSGNCQNSICAAKKSTGGSCYKDVNCSSGKCDTKKGTCTASNLLANGKACTTSPSCASGNCQNSKCAAKKSTGGACYKGVNCTSGNCDTKKGTCSATAATPTSSSPAAGNTGGGSVYTPTPTSRLVYPTDHAVAPSAPGETIDGDFTRFSTEGYTADANIQPVRYMGQFFLQATVPDGGQAVFTVPVNVEQLKRRQDGGNTDPNGNSLPEGMIANYQYQIQSMTVADPLRTSHCYIAVVFANDNPDQYGEDFRRPFGIENVDAAWKTSQGYGQYHNGDQLWTSISIKATCDPGVTAVINTAYVSHLDGPKPTVADWYLTPAVAPTANAEEYTNGGFETGDFTGWSGLSNAAVISGTAPSTTFAGTKAAQLTVGGALGQTATISQILSPLGAPQRRQVGSADAPLPFKNMLYSFSWKMKVLAYDASGATTAATACSYFFNINGKRAGNNPIYTNVPAPGWFQDGYQNYPL
jgi:hypothetical protein